MNLKQNETPLSDQAMEQLLKESPPSVQLDTTKRKEIWKMMEDALVCRKCPALKDSAVFLPKRHGWAWLVWTGGLAAAAAAAILLTVPLLKPIPVKSIFKADTSLLLPVPAGAWGCVQHVYGACVMRGADRGETVLRRGDAIRIGAVIESEPGGGAIIRLQDNSILRLSENTEVTFLSERSLDKHTLRLNRGTLSAQIARRDTRDFSIEAPPATLRVLGTEFQCSVFAPLAQSQNTNLNGQAVAPASMALTVLSGAVEVGTGKTNATVMAGQRTIITDEAAVVIDQINDMDYVRDWIFAQKEATDIHAVINAPNTVGLLDSLWGVDVVSGRAQHLANMIGWSHVDGMCGENVFLVNNGGVLFTAGKMPVGGAGNPIVQSRLVMVNGKGQKVFLEFLNEYSPWYSSMSPDKRKIAFLGRKKSDKPDQRDPGLYLLDLEMRQIRMLLSGDLKTRPAWSPDSRWIAISKSPGYVENHALVLIDTLTDKVVETGWRGAGAIFSPNGKEILFSSDLNGGSWYQGVPPGNLYLAEIPSGKPRQLTHGTEDGAVSPIFSPDGQRIAYWEHMETDEDEATYILHVLDLKSMADRVIQPPSRQEWVKNTLTWFKRLAQTNRPVPPSSPIGWTSYGTLTWIKDAATLVVDNAESKQGQRKLFSIDLTASNPVPRDVFPKIPAPLQTEKASAKRLLKVFYKYQDAMEAIDLLRFEDARQRYREGVDMLKALSEGPNLQSLSLTPEDLRPYMEVFDKNATKSVENWSMQTVERNLGYMGTFIEIYENDRKSLPENMTNMIACALNANWGINHMRSDQKDRVRCLFKVPWDKRPNVVTSYEIVQRDPSKGILIVRTLPMDNGDYFQTVFKRKNRRWQDEPVQKCNVANPPEAAPAVPEPTKAPTVDPQPISSTPEMSAAIMKTLQPKLRFVRMKDNELHLTAGTENPPVNLAFRVDGKRFRGSGDWEPFACFACPAHGDTKHYSSGYGFFRGLEGGKTYKFKFKFVPDKQLAKGKEAAGMDTYYNGEIETDWMELMIPPVKGAAFNGFSDFRVISPYEAKRDDALFDKEWKDFKITTGFSNEYWMASGGFVDNIVGTWHNPKKPAAFCLKLVALESRGGEQGSVKTVYNISPYFLS